MVIALEGRVENGAIRLRDSATLPENAEVVVVVTSVDSEGLQFRSPRLANSVDAKRFEKSLTKVSDAKL